MEAIIKTAIAEDMESAITNAIQAALVDLVSIVIKMLIDS